MGAHSAVFEPVTLPSAAVVDATAAPRQRPRSRAVVPLAAALVIAVAAMQSSGDGMLAGWLRSMHGR